MVDLAEATGPRETSLVGTRPPVQYHANRTQAQLHAVSSMESERPDETERPEQAPGKAQQIAGKWANLEWEHLEAP